MSTRTACSLVIAVIVGGCAAGRMVTHYVAYSNPPELAGTWVDSALASPSDTVAWILGPGGLDQTLTLHRDDSARESTRWISHVQGYGYWYVPGGLHPAGHGRICFRSRARGHDSCYPYAISIVAAPGGATPARRRMVIFGYRGLRHTRDRVLYRRLAVAPTG